MKRLLIIYEGVADGPLDALEGCTPLSLARNNNASVLVTRGAAGVLDWSENDASARAEYRLATLLGVAQPEARLLRRGPVEAAGTAVDPGRWTFAYRGNYVPTDDGVVQESRVENLTEDETHWLTDALRESLDPDHVTLEVVGDARVSVMFDQLTGKITPGIFPFAGEDAERFDVERKPDNDRDAFMVQSAKALTGQSLNDVRLDLGQNPASMLWLWGGGSPVDVGRGFLGAPIKAAMITNSPLAKGMAHLLGMHHVALGEVWSETPNPQMVAADEIRSCLEDYEMTVVYVEAPAEGGTFGTPIEKVKGIDRIDIHVLGTMLKGVDNWKDVRVLITALPEEGIYMEQTPMLVCGRGITPDKVKKWDEELCMEGSAGLIQAERCLTMLIGE